MSVLLPRLYQDEAVKAAASRNINLRMDTGSGKTLVSVLLIRHLTSLPRTSSEHTLVAFLVPTVALVDQQTEVLRAQTSLRVTPFRGSDGVDYWKQEQWMNTLAETDVVVCVGQIFLNVLNNSYFSLNKVSLIVFDEAHHASKNHPYAQILRDHYHAATPGSPLPRILGLTASPIFNPKNPGKSIAELEANLDARIYEVTGVEHLEALREAAPRPVERFIEFEPPPWNEPTVAETKFLEMYGGEMDKKAINRIDTTRRRLGLLAASIHVLQLAQDRDAPPAFLLQLAALADFPIVPSSTISPQAEAILSLLEGYKDRAEPSSTAFHAIVFCQQRSHARILAELVRRADGLKGWLKPGVLVGHGGNDGDDGMAIKRQQEVLAAFRRGELNLLFATQVAEEGIDMRECNVVVRADGLQTMTAYIQSRGRARSAGSHYIVLAERDSRETFVYHNFVEQEPALRDLYSSRLTEEEEPEEPELEDTPQFRVEATGALLTFQSAIPLLAQFCSLLRTDKFAPLPKPHYTVDGFGRNWTCELRLPMIAALGGIVSYRSAGWVSKKGARQAVAFEACVELHRRGAINGSLLPVRESRTLAPKDVDGREIQAEDVDKDGVEMPFETGFGDVMEGGEAWANVVELQWDGKSERVGLVCASDLGAELEGEGGSLHAAGGGGTIVVNVVRSSKIEWSSEEERTTRLGQLHQLNADAARTAINRRVEDGDARFTALWAPLTDHGDIDWSIVKQPFSPVELATLEEGQLVVLLSRWPSLRFGKLVQIRQDANTLSETSLVENTLESTSKRRKLVKTYPRYMIYCKVAFQYHDISETEARPLLEIKAVLDEPSNLLVPSASPSITSPPASPPKRRSFPLSMCSSTKLSEGFWHLMSMVPSLNRLLDDLVQVGRAKRRFGMQGVDSFWLREALTPPSTVTGYDYELLETLGDSLLKLATTVYAYLSHPTMDEGRLSTLRQNSIDNRFLHHRAVDSGFGSYILAQRFRTGTWTPRDEDALVEEGEGGEWRRVVGRKALSDTMEASLGAAFVSASGTADGLAMVLQMGTQLGLCFGGTQVWGEREGARRLFDLEGTGEVGQVPPGLRELQEALGYRFKGKGDLLLQAVTHRSYAAATTYSHDRLEFLGDALLDAWATTRLYTLYPAASPRLLTFRRTPLVSNNSLCYVAIIKLNLHHVILHSSPFLERAMQDAHRELEEGKFGWEQMVSGELTWLWEGPKPLGDVLEACLGAVFVDAGLEVGPVFDVLDRVFGEMMPLLGQVEQEPRDPYSRLLMLRDSMHCAELSITTSRRSPAGDCLSTCTFHEQTIGEGRNASKQVARQVAAFAGLGWLKARGELGCGCARAEEKVEVEGKEEEKEGAGEGEVGAKRPREEGEGEGGQEMVVEAESEGVGRSPSPSSAQRVRVD